jgi:two-component system CheB/CheR fusion protein
VRAEGVLVRHYAPVGVLIDEHGGVLEFKGDTSPYLQMADFWEAQPGSSNVFKLLRQGLSAPLRRGLERLRISSDPQRIAAPGVTLKIIPATIVLRKTLPRRYWILFEPRARRLPRRGLPDDAGDRRVQALRQDLMAAREAVQAAIEAHEKFTQDLASADHQLRVANERLRHANSELAAVIMRIQSSNTQLQAANQQLGERRVQLQRTTEDLKNFLGCAEVAAVLVSGDLRIRSFTPLAERAFGLRTADLGAAAGKLTYAGGVDVMALVTGAIAGAAASDTQVLGRDGRVSILRVRPYRTETDAIDGATLVLIDADDLVRTREALHNRVAELKAADRRKSDSLAVLAHELRTPLAAIGNAGQILGLGADAEIHAASRDLIERQVDHLAHLVDDLRDAASIECGKLKLRRERVDFKLVVAQCADRLRGRVAERRQSFSVCVAAEPVWVRGDPAHLEQAVSNLLVNAHRYSGEGGRIEAHLEVSGGASREALFRVLDNGAGIDAELLPRVFDLFTQADRTLAHSRGGLGLGLHLVRALVELHGGRVAARSDGANCGSEFTLCLPLETASDR